MGANQSSKQQISKQRNTNLYQHHQQQPQQVVSGKKLSSSLRKSVGNVLTSTRLSTSSEKSSNNNKCKKNSSSANKEILSDQPQQVRATTFGTDTVDYNLGGANLMLSSQCQQQQQQVTDTYYVSPTEYGNSFMAKTVQNGGANNYASQSQLMLSAPVMGQSKQQQQQQQQQQVLSSSVYNKNVPKAHYSYHSEQPTREMDSVKARDGLFIALDHQSGGGSRGNIISRSQKHHLRYDNHQMQLQQQQHHPSKAINAITTTTSQSTPFHLSRAVNTKTSSVLNNNSKNIGSSVSMPNAPVGFIASSLTSAPPPPLQNNALQSLSASSQAYQIQHQHQNHHQSPYAQQYLYSGEPTTPQYYEDSENQQQQQQYYMKSLLDEPKSQTSGRRRYKCPKQQYQYLNTSSSPSSMPVQQHLQQQQQQHLDFHQYFNKQSTNFNHQQDHQHQLTLDSSNYNRSYSFGSARTIENSGKKNKTHNKLMSIFQNNNNNSSRQQYSNTIHLGDKRRIQLKQLTASGYSITPNTSSNQRSCPGSLKRTKAAPLSAQQASYEAMRTIDMYLIRQIARSCMDFEMEQKIELEIRLRELAAQSMLEARNEIDVLEVEKSLLTSDQRMNCYASLLEQQRKQLSNPSLSTADSGRGSKNGNYRRSINNSRYSDVIGGGQTTSGSTPNGSVVNGHQQNQNQNQNNTTSSCSPSFSSLSQTSPSKLSPVSGESANSPSSMSSSSRRSQNSQVNQRTTADQQSSMMNNNNNNNNNNSNLNNNNNNSNQPSQHLRQNHSRRSTNNIHSTLSAKQKAKNKKREQLMQTITSLSNINCNMVADNRASISASEIRIPLMWKDVDHFKGRGDYKRYAIFCLLKIDSQIYDTQLISDVDREVTDVTFDDLVVFNEIDHNFELILEVYSCVYYEQFSLSSTPRKLKEKLTNSVSKAMGRRLATQTASINYTKELEAYDKSYRFAMIASATMKLDDVSNKVKTYDLVLTSSSAPNYNLNHNDSSFDQSLNLSQSQNNSATTTTTKSIYSTKMANNSYNNNKDANNKNTLPLFGHFCCKLMVKPDVFDKNIKTGYLKVASINIPNTNNHPSDSTLESSGRGSKSPSSTSTSSPSSQSSIMNHASSAESAAKFKLANIAASNKMAALSLSSSTLHWGLLRNFVLYLWPVNEQTIDLNTLRSGEMPHLENPRKPRLILNIDKYSRLLRVSNSSLTIETDKGCFVLGAYCPPVGDPLATINYNQADELAHWLRTIEQHIYDSHIWGSVLNHYPPHTKQSMNNNNNNNLKPPSRRLSDNTSRENAISMLMDNNNTNSSAKKPSSSYRDHYGGSAILQAHL